ncbi:hypothetical protein AC1031_000381 [Aphanomyces cochlioides]|nr:hypothetical protein AC1031_000375 [Aphanomyces cochlioides]KAG9415988.1 hypothetical protein AC1031_000378 [Aphanomyces cochlioides]KAG9415991.1 hypothetical protein AC1031_000381 [Aphanomyces cochlioides]
MQANADRQKKWEEDNANHPIDQDEKQRQYDAKLALKKQQQETLEAKMNFAMTNGLRVAIDLSFLTKENLRERNSVLKQVGSAYGVMKKSPHPQLLSLHLASYNGEIASFCDSKGVQSWKVTTHAESVESLFPNNRVVFLSPDATNVLTTIDPNTVYIVGGIADRTVRKGETMSKASSKAITTARLPVREYVNVRSHVLNIDSVLLLLLEVHNGSDWKDAFDKILPKRLLK